MPQGHLLKMCLRIIYLIQLYLLLLNSKIKQHFKMKCQSIAQEYFHMTKFSFLFSFSSFKKQQQLRLLL